MSLLLSSLNKNIFMDEELFDAIRNEISERILDESPKVRCQAIAVLFRMQEPGDPECPVIKLYIDRLCKDISAEVRRAAIQYGPKTIKFVHAVLKRLTDIDESVRKAAYVYFSKIKVTSLSIEQRQLILRTGLHDPCASVRTAVRDVVLKTWLITYDDDYCRLLYALDSEMDTELSILVLNTLFEQSNLETLFKQLPLDRDRKLIPIEQLNGENVLYWRCFIEYMGKKSADETVDKSIPELTSFCKYIKEFQTIMENFEMENTNSDTEPVEDKKITYRFIHLQLFELVKTYDLSDEFGRGKLRELIEETLIIESCTIPVIKCIVEHYEKVVPDVSSRVTSLAHVISEIRMKPGIIDESETEVEPGNDKKTLITCLTIMACMLQARSVRTLTSTTRSLLENLAMPNLEHSDAKVQNAALRAVGMCLHLDGQFAKENLKIFFAAFLLDDEDMELWQICLSFIFDMFLRYGLDHFDIGQEDNLIGILMNLIYHEDRSIRTTATIGFCKLLLHGKLKNHSLLSALIIRMYDTATVDDERLRSSLVYFFKYYPSLNKEGSICIQKAFLPTLKKLVDAPDDSSLSAIDMDIIAKFIIDLSSVEFHAPGSKDYTAHNQLALELLKEIVDENSSIDKKTLIKSLKHLTIRLDNEELRAEMNEAVGNAIKMNGHRGKVVLKYLQDFEKSINEVH
uniref:Nuclear condensin complex subunit 3 C-terminal domain-containing protein n=1 Tax=Bracon brevicornis TaxID=1563983 RepID=A0A6V7L400_9HYME